MRSARILFKGREAGVLYETPRGGSRFVYASDWNGSIGCSLPAHEREHGWSAGLHPFFQHLGPEGWLREKQARLGRLQEEDDFGLLIRYGRDCIGAVSIVAEAPDEAPPPVEADPLSRAATTGKRTLSGVQKKLLVRRQGNAYAPAEATGPASHIAKFNHQSNPTLVRNELLSLKLAADILGPTQVTRFEGAFIDGLDEPALVVERFDRTPDGASLRLEDFAQILNRPRGNDYQGKYEGSHEEVAEAIRKHSARAVLDLEQFFRRVALNVVIGNADGHLKNFSLLERPEGLRLAPVYDVLNSLTYGGAYDRRLALEIDGDRPDLDRVDAKRLTAFGLSIGLPPKIVATALRDVAKRAAKSRVIVPPAGEEADGFVHRYAEIVRAACLRIAGE